MLHRLIFNYFKLKILGLVLYRILGKKFLKNSARLNFISFFIESLLAFYFEEKSKGEAKQKAERRPRTIDQVRKK